MTLLIVFAFLGGVVTILSPCILAVLPIILSGTTGGKGRPLGVVVGFVSGFTFFTLFLTSIVQALNVSPDALRYVAIVVLALFGLALVVPKLQLQVELLFSKLAARAPKGGNRTGFGGGILIGLSLGLLWTPCVGPILASVISLALTGSVNGGAVLITLSYAMGTALPMLAIMVGGRGLMNKVPWLTRHAAHIQQAFGVLMILTSLAIVFNADKKIQAYVTERLPDYAGKITGFERNEMIEEELQRLEQGDSEPGPKINKADESDAPLAPELVPGGEWLNSNPLTLEGQRGNIVMVEFLTYSCINCIRTFPYLNAWYDEYKDEGFTIIGVHTPEFEFEKSASNVRKALADHDIEFPVIQDNNYATWRAYGNRYWPRKYLVDHNGRIVYDHIGEGKYEETEMKIRELIMLRNQELSREAQEFSDAPLAEGIQSESREALSRELYFGASRNERLGNGEPGTTGDFLFAEPETIEDETLYLVGNWRIAEEYAEALEPGAYVLYRYNSRRVFAVAGADSETNLTVEQDNDRVTTSAGEDVSNSMAKIQEERLYRLIDNGKTEKHTLKLIADKAGLKLFTFTFG